MKAAVVTAPAQPPIYMDCEEPVAAPGEELITVHAAALSPFTKARASGAHYSGDSAFPAVAGSDGVGRTSDGRRVYFVLPRAPNGSFAEATLVRPAQCVPIPDSLDDVTAAAIANPGMSAWAALVERAHLQPGETVLINGATGTAGRLAVQLAKHLGAKKVIATGRNARELEELRALGADVVLPFSFSPGDPQGPAQFEAALSAEFAHGIDVVVDYLWGTSARSIVVTIAKAVEDAHPVRFVQVGEASREPVELPAAALRSSAIVLMGSGVKSVPMSRLLAAISSVFEVAAQGNLLIEFKPVSLAQVESHWEAPGRPRIVFTMR